MSSPQPYVIDVPQSKIENLQKKLSLAEYPDQLEDAGWDLGCPLAEIKRLAEAWEKWDWRQAEKLLNELPQFHVEIEVKGFETLDIHFVHQKSEVTGAIPLLFVHGWPGSFIEVRKILPLLTQRDGSGPSFHIVAPSLPNFGFSQRVSKRGFGVPQYAETCHKLMARLGYKEYVTQGGDWGFWITRAVGKRYPKNCKASHLNMITASAPTLRKHPLLALQHSVRPYTDKEKKGFERTQWFEKEGFGYNLLQSSKPSTIGFALHDSPIALLSWIYEKLHDWTDAYPWTDDEILTWISIYQFSRAGPGAPGNIYYESRHATDAFNYKSIMQYNPTVKLGLTHNPKELQVLPDYWARTLGEVVFEAHNEHGGHFYAHEHPELLARDIKKMFGKAGGAYAVVKGKDGYEK